MGIRLSRKLVLIHSLTNKKPPTSGGFFFFRKLSVIPQIQNLLKKPSAKALAQSSLEDAKRHLLSEQAAAEYHSKMAEYYTAVIRRLSNYLIEGQKDGR